MSPPAGNDNPIPGRTYVLTIFGTETAFQVEGDDIYLRPYDASCLDQKFVCDVYEGRLGFVNQNKEKRLGRNRYENIKCEDSPATRGSWQAFFFRANPGGGFIMSTTIDDTYIQLRRTDDGSPGNYWLTIKDRDHSIPVVVGMTQV